MRNSLKWLAAWSCAQWLAGVAIARPQTHEWAEPEIDVDLVGDVDATDPVPQKILQDTIWIADWTFDIGGACSQVGWEHADNRILNDGSNYWHIETGVTTTTGMTGRSAAVGYHDNNCCESVNGYGNDWYQAIRITYTGAAILSLDLMMDAVYGSDFLSIETDPFCDSFSRVDLNVDPSAGAASFRVVEDQAYGLLTDGEWVNLALSNYGAGTHCVYIAFFSDDGLSPCDGGHVSTIGEGAVVDNIVITDASGTRMEDFEDGTLDIGTFVNIADSTPFGTWARLFSHITDNDLCTENRTCAWLWTDNTTPTLFNDPSMAFGPGGFVVRGWLDDAILSPWVSLASTPTASSTVIQFRRFPGNFFTTSRIAQNWSVRGRSIGTGAPCAADWGHAHQWNSLSSFGWQTLTFDMSTNFDPTAEEIQIRHRTSDWQWIAGGSAPVPSVPGPGPYVDRTRIGRLVLSGPVISTGIDTRSQAQDAAPAEIDPTVTPAGEHHRPTTDRFGTCAYSAGAELGVGKRSPNLITGDSTSVRVRGVRPGGEIVTSVQFCGSIVRGPHAGKAPPPWSVGPNGFFCLAADSVRSPSSGQVIPELFFVDFDDTYFRGGDELHSFWAATDNGGGFTSNPEGLTALPASALDAYLATNGLREVSFLPTINWDEGYLARIAVSPHGDLEPTPGEQAGSSQRNCILYYQAITAGRRSGDVQRTSFMYTLDRLGYRDPVTLEHDYDVYDHQGLGNTNNHLGGRMTIEQAQGYNLIIYDTGNRAPGIILPDGVQDIDSGKIDQAGWFRNWLAQAGLSDAGFATLWILGSNVVEERPANFLLSTTMGVSLLSSDLTTAVNPEVFGVAAFTFDQGSGAAAVSYNGDLFVLNGGCSEELRKYDALQTSSASAVQTHSYRRPGSGAAEGGAIIMNRSNAEQWNTIMQSHPWFDIRDTAGTPASPARALLAKTLGAILPADCVRGENPVDAEDDEIAAAPQTALHQNQPNPFNPTTQIRFDLNQSEHVRVRIYAVGGKLVRTLIDAEMPAGRDHVVTWNGLDDQNVRAGSGVYFYRLEAGSTSLTRKMVVLR